MTAAGPITFSYDKNGNQTSRTEQGSTTTSYSYDFEDRLIKAGNKTYTRDALGRAVSSTEGSTKIEYAFDGREVIQEKTGYSLATHYTRGLGGRIISRGSLFGTTPSYYHYDALGSVVGLSGSGGSLTDTCSYDAFGNERSRTGTSEQPYWYLGNAYARAASFATSMRGPTIPRGTLPLQGSGEGAGLPAADPKPLPLQREQPFGLPRPLRQVPLWARRL